MKGRVYLSGKITGLPMEEVEKKFSEAEEYFKEKGYEVENPLKISPYKEGKKWHEYMMEDLQVLLGCEYFAPLEDIRTTDSVGMMIEIAFATKMNKTFLWDKTEEVSFKLTM